MPRDCDSNGGSERSSGQFSGRSMGHLDDAAIAKAILGPEERRRKAEERRWWLRLIDWWRWKSYNDNW